MTDMGRTFVEGRVLGPNGASETVRFLVDDGATYTVLPEEVWTRLAPDPDGRRLMPLQVFLPATFGVGSLERADKT